MYLVCNCQGAKMKITYRTLGGGACAVVVTFRVSRIRVMARIGVRVTVAKAIVVYVKNDSNHDGGGDNSQF